ncbi:zinc finger protein ichor [Halictus rubicundus]|uniref:zinc finger protein ichor n=1 Tax=Halictus rubicundus TaxID=77578 RepID=UPI0040367591
MKYETQSGPPAAPPHLTSSGVEPPHSSQGTGIVVGGSPAEVVGVDSLLLSPWGATGPDFLEPPDVKQTAAGLQDAWDTILLGSSVGVASAQSLAELKPLPPFTGYTGHLSINGIPGHHYHTIASSAQRPSLPSSSPTSSSNQEYYESPVVSSSTPCPQGSQKQQQQQQQHHQHQQQQQQQQQHHHHQQQQLPQSTQQVEYDIEDIAEIIGSAIADTTVPGGGNGAGSEHDADASRDWIDIAEWIDTACSPKAQETTSPSPYSQIYATATPSTQAQQHGSTLQSLLTHGYAPLLNARLQSANAGLQNASCGETPSSTSPYPPVSPPGRVSTSCSPDHLLHSSFAAPSHPRKRSRPAPGSQNPSKKSPGTGATALPYGTESGLIGGKEKPVHRCSICNRGFLNKSNIKVHLRTHTGEKPFRCEVCGKAFRQKAHLIKHQQIHKRIGRD